jgi:hypothetical protein
VRVVWANAQPKINEKAAVAARICGCSRSTRAARRTGEIPSRRFRFISLMQAPNESASFSPPIPLSPYHHRRSVPVRLTVLHCSVATSCEPLRPPVGRPRSGPLGICCQGTSAKTVRTNRKDHFPSIPPTQLSQADLGGFQRFNPVRFCPGSTPPLQDVVSLIP